MADPADLRSRLRAAVDALPAGLRDHVLRVEVEAERLAHIHAVDVEQAKLAALGHDLVRHLPGADLLVVAERYGLAPDTVERQSPILVHGPVAARILARDYAVADADLLAAVDCHTTGRAAMSRLEKVLLVADKIEPEKLERYPEWQEVHALSRSDLDAALLRHLDLYLEQATERRWLLHHRVVEARNDLLGLDRGA